jgi:hypothetical protein
MTCRGSCSAAGLATGLRITKVQEMTMGGEWSQNMAGVALIRDRQRDRDGEDDNRAKKARLSM